jgi:lecithin:retinol acyltransferase
MLLSSIHVISRPKKNRLVTHFGVAFSSTEVYDYTPEEGFRRITLREFADGEPVAVVREIPWHQAAHVRARLNELIRNPRKYDLLTWNCETFAEWLTSGTPKSGQVIGGLFMLGIMLALALATRS